MKVLSILKNINKKKLLLFLLIAAFSFLLVGLAHAGNTDVATPAATTTNDTHWYYEVIIDLLQPIISALAWILSLIVGVMVGVASYSTFIGAPAVIHGWKIVRDVCNMFFALIMLIIAFSTIVGYEEYGYKKMLPKLVAAAILINFSKLLCGLMIDVAQVVMLTFVNAFKDVGAGNMLQILGLSNIVSMSPNNSANQLSVIVASIFGLIYVLIAIVVIASMLAMLVIRIVMIWIYVVLSPLAFFLQAVPSGGEYASKWWKEWSSNLIIGPVLAFFVWLSFASLDTTTDYTNTSGSVADKQVAVKGVDSNTVKSEGSQATDPAQFARFVIAIGMLIGGMKIAQEVGGVASSAIGAGIKKLNAGKAAITGLGNKAANLGKRAVSGGARSIGRGVRNTALLGIGKAMGGGKRDENGKLVDGTKAGNFALQWRQDMNDSQKKKRTAARSRFLQNIGIGEKASAAGKELGETRIMQNMGKSFKAGAPAAAIATLIGGPLAGLAAVGIAATVGVLMNKFIKRKQAKNQPIINDYESKEKDISAHEDDITKNKQLVDEYERNQKIEKDLKSKGLTSSKEYKDASKYIFSPANQKNYSNAKNNYNLATDQPAAMKIKQSYENDKNIFDSLSKKTNRTKVDDANLQMAKARIEDKDNIESYEVSNRNLNNPTNKKYLVDHKAEYDKAKKYNESATKLTSYSRTLSAFDGINKTSKVAKDRIKAQTDPTYWANANANSVYSSTGLTKTDQKEMDYYNTAEGGKALANLLKSIDTTSPSNVKMNDAVALSMAKKVAAWGEAGGDVSGSSGVSQIAKALSARGTTSSGDSLDYSKHKGTVLTSFRPVVGGTIDKGSGDLQYDAFSKNSVKSQANHDDRKDIIGVSFDKFDKKAKDLGLDESRLGQHAGVNVVGADMNKTAEIMSSIFDDEIKALQSSAKPDVSKIAQLKAAKDGLFSDNLKALKLVNSDVKYDGATDSEKRINHYASTVHENIHGAGAKSETLTEEGALKLVNAKLYGNNPDTKVGYDQEIGRLIAKMEQAGNNEDEIRQAVDSEISKYSGSPAQSALAKETGRQQTLSEAVPDLNEAKESDAGNLAEIVSSLKNEISSLDGSVKSLADNGLNLSAEAAAQYKKNFDDLSKDVMAGDQKVVDMLNKTTTKEIRTSSALIGKLYKATVKNSEAK
jgi:hypothetical protein